MSEPIITLTKNVHCFFGLSYANYLVLPRSALQSMPEEWQAKFVALVEELHETIPYELEPGRSGYEVRLRDESGKFIPDTMADYRHGRRWDTSTAPATELK